MLKQNNSNQKPDNVLPKSNRFLSKPNNCNRRHSPVISRTLKNFRILRELLRLRFQKVLLFRLSFFGPFFVDGSLFAVQLLVFQAVYANVDTIGGWGRGEMILYIGAFSLLNAVSMVIFFFGLNAIPAKIKSGDMDLYLTKPVSPLLRLTFEQVNPGSVPLVVMSIGIIGYGFAAAELHADAAQIAAYVFWLLVMAVLYYEMEVIIRALSFFFVTDARLTQLEEAGIELCMKLPGIAFYGIYKVIFYGILPYGIMATLPVQSLIGEMSWQLAGLGLLVLAVFSALTAILWQSGIRHYNSASS
ncbi:MAG: ABC transporter permease [Lachnospiraceae bacterium]|nr:ABC transporter permease [Lachnospiraceae bacterium]